MDISINKKREEQLYYLAYALWMIYAVLHITMWGDIELIDLICQYLRKIAYLLLVIRFFYKKAYTRRDIFGIFLIAFSCFLASHSVYNKQIIPVAIFVCFAGDVKFDKILKLTLSIQTIIMVVTIFASQMGMIEDVIWYEGSRVRHSLGYEYCGYPAHLLFFMTMMWVCIRKKVYFCDTVLLLAANYVMYFFTDSRTDFYLAVLFLVGVFFWTRDFHAKAINYFRNFVTKFCFLILASGSILVHMFYQPAHEGMQRLNQILNGRLQLGYDAISQYGFSLFGEKIRWFGQGSLKADPTRVYNYVGCSFLKELLSYGLIFLIILGAGYYFLGKRIAKEKDHMLSWAVLMSLVYSVINAHLCVLTFNVFILACGSLFSSENEKVSPFLTDAMLHVWNKKIPEFILRSVRVAVFTGIFCYLTYIQSLGTAYLVNYSAMHRWMLCGVLLLLAVLCSKSKKGSIEIFGNQHSMLFYTTILFLLLACISDFFVTKKFQYSAFCMFAFGGLLFYGWRQMQDPQQIIEEFKWGYEIWFYFTVILCIFVRPAYPGICYSGIFTRPEYLGITSLIAMVFFLDNKKRTTALVNAVGVFLSFYMIWMTQNVVTVMIAAAGLLIFIIFEIVMRIQNRQCITLKDVLLFGCGAMLGIVCVLGLREILYHISPLWGIGLIFENDINQVIEKSLSELLQSGDWFAVIRSKLWLIKEYLLQTNLFGHAYLPEIAGKTRWAENSIAMNLYRYGLLCGFVYAVMLISYVKNAVQIAIKKKRFLYMSLPLACSVLAMAETIEMPFVQIGWIVFWIGLVMILVAKEEVYDEVS